MSEKKVPCCPHCGVRMQKWKVPDTSTWNEMFHWVCFNDECSYYVQGWKWMAEKYNQKVSYRHRMNPGDGTCGPLPVWSPEAHKDFILPDEDEEDKK